MKAEPRDFDNNPEWLEHCRQVEEVVERSTSYDEAGDIVWLSISREEWNKLGETLSRIVVKWLDAESARLEAEGRKKRRIN